ncbi:MAG: 30S ribosomal protein S12 methylthiotransferase RimO [Chitinophagales bacterium]|nr:30S ribosomal protein S12 methylthiotransferase RimO [Bacteroidota bacterium]MBP7399358.1 30S ribosomal protein S12 methylthiotransferase RimO [Chitinophagales bacterium]MBP8754893.1 30S ribosomal protein S12 methylthiotransferase RimO [Chitinophagales bacterium]MBP9190299.1 30S ribosomal protein S12 methylthiotransferase RimO [Chitinophagales bacterium]MBP9548371.1 30S ribosomal protein S12 methylthiotransferase RimO [Chitinophagales bacterium]
MKTKHSNKDKVNIITLGCSKNIVDSEVILSQLKGNDIDAYHERPKDDCNIVVINTCGFIENAKQESINTILNYADAKANGEIEKLYVTGCLSQRYREELQLEIPQVDAWFGTMELPGLLQKFNADYKHELIGERSLSTPKHYAYLKISEGCNRTCAFCAIPLMRGAHRSKTIEEIITEAKHLASIGVKEIMLIAQELTYYGLDIYKKRALSELLYKLNAVEGIEWIRLHYAYPSKFPMEIIDAIADCEKVCNYLDIPLQHSSNNVLERMRRQITAEETKELIAAIRNKIPDITLRTTMLVGFPGETEEDIENLLEFIKETRFDRLGVFTYSHEDGTSGFELDDDVPEEIKQERLARVMELQATISLEINQTKVGKIFKTIIDRKEGGYFIGRTEGDSPEVDNEVLIDAAKHFLRVGDFAEIKITSSENFDLFGEPV